MKNLNLWNVSVKDLNISPDDEFLMCYGHDESNAGELYVCSHNLIVRSFGEDGEEKWSKDLSEVSSGSNQPVDITFLSLPNTVCVGLANGELFTIGDVGASCDMAGVCGSGLLAMEWSPDQELLLLVTKDLNTVLMSCTFDPITETNLLAEEFGEKQFITVGWGKKETQFHGREGKQAAKVKTEVEADPEADNTVKITWRGDGQLYAVGFTADGIRRFKVFDREGNLQYTSEKQTGLQSNLSWRPSGNVIATTQRLSDKYVVAFFEKNGLKHGGFDIPVSNTTEVEDLLWSSDSEIITLQCRDTTDNSQKLLLFTMCNYHWYLKQSLVFNTGQTIRKILWDNDFDVANNKKLHIVLSNGQHYSYTWIWSVDHSNGKTDDDDAAVTVIDGKKLLVTGFRQTVVPPPMAALEIELDAFANSINFASQDQNSNSFFAITTDHKVIIYEQTQKFPLQYKILNTIEIEKYYFPFQNYNWHWLNTDTIICIKVDVTGYHLVEYTLESNKMLKKNVEALLGEVVRIVSHPTDVTKAFLQISSGDILQYTLGGQIEPLDVSFGVACPTFRVVSIDDNLHFIGLSHKGHLYVDDSMIMNNVSSFFVHTDFLLITTQQHFLLSTELSKVGVNAIKEHSKIESPHVYKRKIERGAKLVIAVPNDTRTVFQMPRGNLETIQPRPLSLKIIGKQLDSLKYREAFDLMRKQRINLNLIHDHNPAKFLNSIDVFLANIKNSWLSLFLSDLENSDVTKTMYSSSYADRPENIKSPENFDRKIRKVCELIRSGLSSRSDTDQRILPFLTSFVKTNTEEDLESALFLIKDLKRKEEAGSKLPVGSDEALKYLLYMVEVNKLFDVALGMYDFDLVLLVATKSQKDPKEYIPMLNELHEMEENYKRFSINKHLKRFDKAVQCLVACGPDKHEELTAFVKYHSLYRQALNLLTPGEAIYELISDYFGNYLRLERRFIEAGIVFERSGNIDFAIESYKDALEWEMALTCARSWPEEKFKELCWDLVQGLKNEKRHKEALTILDTFYHDEDKSQAILYAIETGQYKTAIRLCTECEKEKPKIESAVWEEYTNVLEVVEANWTTFVRHRDRLRVVRELKQKHPVEMYDSFANRDCDLYSDAGSTVASSSRGSSRSYRSNKNKRKHERKVASIKPGSQYEDVGLVMALHTLVTTSFELRLQVKDLNTILCYFGKEKDASVLQTSLEKLLKEMKDSFREIWTNELVLEATSAAMAALGVEGEAPQGIATLDPHMRIAPQIQEVSWKLEGIF
ncbi:hypothetical protein O0L34_g15312 [Tuta absoluta]|nr:hypothetical protein O0L34_g15312 [Tuta absoluta]